MTSAVEKQRTNLEPGAGLETRRLIMDFLNLKAQDLDEWTVRNYRNVLERIVTAMPKTIDADLGQTLMSIKAAVRQKRDKRGKVMRGQLVSKHTSAQYLRIVDQFLRYAFKVKRGDVADFYKSLTELLVIPKNATDKSTGRGLEPEHIRAAGTVLKGDNLDLFKWWCLTGLRLTAMVFLEPADLQSDGTLVYVQKRKATDQYGRKVKNGELKLGLEREAIGRFPGAVRQLKRMGRPVCRSCHHPAPLTWGCQMNGYPDRRCKVCGSESMLRARVTRMALSRWVKAVGKLIGCPDLHPHMFRHTAATTFYKTSGHNLEATKVLLGHSNVSVTDRYIHVPMSEMQEYGRAMEEYYNQVCTA